MTSVLLFEFDKIFKIFLPKPPKSIREICYRALPKVQWNEYAKKVILNANKESIPVILVAYQGEILVKEAIYGAGLCPYFDHFIFLDELDAGTEHTNELVMSELVRKYGLCKPLIYQPSMLHSPSACI